MTTIDVGPGMRSADIPDASQGKPDHGTCPTCSKRDVRLKKDGTVRQHWKYGWPRSGGNPPCGGSGELPTVLNAGRTARHLAEVRRTANESTVSLDEPHEAGMNPHDEAIERLAVVIASRVADDRAVQFTVLDNSLNRVTAVVDGREYLITITPTTPSA